MPIVSPRRMTSEDVSGTPKLSGGGGAQLAGDTPGRECPHEDLGMRPLIGTKKPSGGTVSDDDSRSSCGRGALPGGSFRLMLQVHLHYLLRDLSRFPHGLRLCGSMGP